MHHLGRICASTTCTSCSSTPGQPATALPLIPRVFSRPPTDAQLAAAFGDDAGRVEVERFAVTGGIETATGKLYDVYVARAAAEERSGTFTAWNLMIWDPNKYGARIHLSPDPETGLSLTGGTGTGGGDRASSSHGVQ